MRGAISDGRPYRDSNAVNPEGKALSRIATEGLSDSERIHPPSFAAQSQQIDLLTVPPYHLK